MSTPTDAPATIGRNRVRAAAAAVLATLLLAAAFAAQTSAAKAPRDFFGIFAENPARPEHHHHADLTARCVNRLALMASSST